MQQMRAGVETQALLARLRTFCFPYGEEKADLIRAVRMSETGQIRMSPDARWIPFTAEQTATRSSFHWEARLDPGRITAVTVIDAYEESPWPPCGEDRRAHSRKEPGDTLKMPT